MIIAIDGPAGAGKTTLAHALARHLGLIHIDTGAMYRAVALKCLRQGVPLQDEDRVAEVARGARIVFQRCAEPGDDGGYRQRVLLDDEDVTEAIRTPDVSALASPVSAISSVRKELVAQQRAMARWGDVVMEGRDIGTVVLPHADLKVFLTASLDERARRRYAELAARGLTVSLEEVKREIRERDGRDSTRSDSPLKPASDAVILDSDGLSAEEVTRRVMDLVRERR